MRGGDAVARWWHFSKGTGGCETILSGHHDNVGGRQGTPLKSIYESVVVMTGACFFAGVIGAFFPWLSKRDAAG